MTHSFAAGFMLGMLTVYAVGVVVYASMGFVWELTAKRLTAKRMRRKR